MLSLKGVLVACIWLGASVRPSLAAGLSCCALSMGAGSMFEVCAAWASSSGCNSLDKCVKEITPAHKYASQWCQYCLGDPENTPCASDALAPFPNYKPPGHKRDIEAVGHNMTTTSLEGLQEIEPTSDVLALFESASHQVPGSSTAHFERRALSHPFSIPTRVGAAHVQDFLIGHLKVTLVTSARGIIQIGIQNLAQRAISWSFQDNTAVDIQSGTAPASKTTYFRYNDGAPGDSCIFYCNE